MISKGNKMVGAILLVSGTTIGAGMLALPVTTGLAGLLPAIAIMTAVWLFMMLTAFYFLEVNLRMKGEVNLISMVHRTLGKPGEVVAWVTYLLLLYALTAAYLLGCSEILSDFFKETLSFDIPMWVWSAAVFLFFGSFVYLGTIVADFLNRMMMIGLIIAYVALVSLTCCHIQLPLLAHIDWRYLYPSISVVLTTFGYHIIIPTLTQYLEHDEKLLKRSIFIGSLIPFLVYLIWQLLVMGVIPVYGENSLSEAAEKKMQITFFLKTLLKSPWISLAVHGFAFFAIVTSLLGVSLSLSDFLADGFKIQKTYLGKFILVCLTFIPPLLFAFFYPHGFVLALKYAGIFILILLALLPALMTWVSRYRDQQFLASSFRVFGGKALLVGTIVISLLLLAVEVTLIL